MNPRTQDRHQPPLLQFCVTACAWVHSPQIGHRSSAEIEAAQKKKSRE
jgi:hypothetical protein